MTEEGDVFMTTQSLMLFMKRILESSSAEKAAASLHQLREILETQNADPEMVKLVTATIISFPEAKEAAKEPHFSEEELKIAIDRAEKRRLREAEMANRGRC